MVDSQDDKFKNLKSPVYSSLAMAFAGIGDAFLYPFLPLYAATIGIPVVWVGFLLSVNRFTRILFNPIVVKCFDNLNVKAVTVLASMLAIVSTVGYGLNLGLLSWITCRIIWGLSFSALRISTATYALSHQNKGLALGLSNGLYEIGPLIALTLSPFIVSHFSIEKTFYILAAISSLALLFAFNTPSLNYVPVKKGGVKLTRVSIVNVLSFLNAFIAEGIVIITLSIFIQVHYKIPILGIAAIASGFLFFRRICSLMLSPIAGIITDRLGIRKVLFISILLVSLGVMFLINNILFVGLLFIFSFSAIGNTVFPLAVFSKSKDKVRAIAQNSLFRDSGAAFGTLLGGILLLGFYLNFVLLICALMQAVFATYYYKTDEN